MITGVEGTGVSSGVSLAEDDQTEEPQPEEEPTGRTLLGLDPVDAGGELAPTGVISVTGHTVVEMAMVEVVTIVESAGQLVTSGAQLVMVISLVAYTVEVVIWTGLVIAGMEGTGVSAGVSLAEDQTEDPQPEDEPTGRTLLGLDPVGAGGELAPTGVISVTGQTVVEMGIVEVVIMVESAGQLVTSGAQLVMVISLVA